jgi:hypothetical protein
MRAVASTVLIAIAVLLVPQGPAASQSKGGQFKGEIVATLLPNGRDMKLVQPFGYVDAKGQVWDVPAGAETDGASIPGIFWITHPPFTGKYRAAAVIHDYYCRTQSRGWQDTHNVFYEAMLTAGVDARTAKVMWAAVYNFGPRWGAGVVKRALPPSIDDQKQFMRDLDAWVARADPSREEIAKAIDLGRVPR